MKIKAEFYVLPEIQFVGGEAQDLYFSFIRTNGEEAELVSATGKFSVCEYVNKSETPLISKYGTIAKSENDVYNTLRVQLTPSETINLSGKYIYQITLKDTKGNYLIPNQGLVYVIQNIDKNAIS